MDNDSTRNDGPLSLAERAKRGLLRDKTKLWLHEIAELEYPTDKTERDRFEKLLHGLAIHGVLHGWSMENLPPESYRICPVKNRFTIVGLLIPRNSYQTWRISQADKPAGSFIDLWLGATPAVETLPPAEPSLPELPVLAVLPETVATGGAAEKRAALLCLLDEVDKRAAEQGAEFNRNSLPGTKAEFYELLKAYCPAFRYITLDSMAGYAKSNCQFQPGAKPDHGKGCLLYTSPSPRD